MFRGQNDFDVRKMKTKYIADSSAEKPHLLVGERVIFR